MRHGWQSGLGRRALAVSLCVLAVPVAAQADVLAQLMGSWGAGTTGPATMQWSGNADGFTLSWTPIGDQATTVKFAPAGRPGVYAGKSQKGWSVMGSMFGDSNPANPLRGDTLYWARTTADAVIVYRMTVDDRGSYRIDRYACRTSQGALQVSWDRRTTDSASGPNEQRLVRIGQ